jgi:hypothetical protein
MARAARYIVNLRPGTDRTFILPSPLGGSTDVEFSPFPAPQLAAGSPSVLWFRARPRSGNPRLQMNLNNVPVIERLVDPGPMRSWHEIINAGVLVESGNQLAVAVFDGAVELSDFVILYEADVPTGPQLAQ